MTRLINKNTAVKLKKYIKWRGCHVGERGVVLQRKAGAGQATVHFLKRARDCANPLGGGQV